jgi:hypothetical protein
MPRQTPSTTRPLTPNTFMCRSNALSPRSRSPLRRGRTPRSRRCTLPDREASRPSFNDHVRLHHRPEVRFRNAWRDNASASFAHSVVPHRRSARSLISQAFRSASPKTAGAGTHKPAPAACSRLCPPRCQECSRRRGRVTVGHAAVPLRAARTPRKELVLSP